MSCDFVAIDFETANGFRGSPCAVGLVRMSGGQITDEYSTLIRPPRAAFHFDYRNVRIHGILPEDVEDAPEVGEVIEAIRAFTGDTPFVAHNAAFDMGVLRSAAEASGVGLSEHRYACTVQMSRRHFTLPSHSLPFAAEAAGTPMTVHHDALHDARACASVARAVLDATGEEEFPAALSAAGVAMSRLAPYDPSAGMSPETLESLARLAESASGQWIGREATTADVERLDPIEPNMSADPGNPLYGQRVLFTGPLGLSRAEAWRRAAACGATPVAMLSGSTTMLVVGGGFRSEDLSARQPRFSSSTLEKVLRLRTRGFDVSVVTEGEFMQSVGGHWPAHGA